MKNLFAIAAIVLATVSFSACGGAKDGEGSTDTTSTMTETVDTTTMSADTTTMSTDTSSAMSADTTAK